MEIQANQIILAATVIFIVGLLIFSVVFQAYGILQEYRSIGTNETDTSQKDTFAALSIVPTILTVLYFAFVGIVVWYVMRKSKEKADQTNRFM